MILSGRKRALLCVQTGSKNRTEPGCQESNASECFFWLKNAPHVNLSRDYSHSNTDMEPGGSHSKMSVSMQWVLSMNRGGGKEVY